MKPIQLSIGSWAYCFGPYKDNPVPFDTVIEKLGRLGFDGVELGGFTVEEPAANVSSA
jgi:sugar phosphate isomerase/epimerase